MWFAVEIYSGVMMYIPSFIKIGSDIQKLMGNTNAQHANG
jgi:hypothetical protein